MAQKIKIGIIGASGYTGGELLRLLSRHPGVELASLTSEQSAGKNIQEIFPFLTGILDMKVESIETPGLASKADFFFMSTPHGLGREVVPLLLQKGAKIVDLSADYRLKKPALYQKWYHMDHLHPDLLNQVVYGLTEVYREKIRKASLVANPGCYPTSILLPLYPLLKENVIDLQSPLIIDAKSGVSGAGRSLDLRTHFSEVDEGIEPYKTGGKHRHIPEIEQEIEYFSGRAVPVTFTPQLLPIVRGMLSVIYIKLKSNRGSLEDLYRKYYGDEPFIKLLKPGASTNPKNVRGSNFCHIGFSEDSRTGITILYGAIDNLTKGASGQAIQNMNLMLGFEETLGLTAAGLFP
ncbi:MAG: N-acetyl-gamma-glutamyl-phosphate reductase [Nitrospiria bacterium]